MNHSQPIDTLIIARHGKPALSRKVKLTWRGYKDWWVKYDEGGLKSDQKFPKKLSKWVDKADVILSSPLKRSIESAELISGRSVDYVDNRLVEAALPPPQLFSLKLRPKTWGTLSRIVWQLGWSGGMESRVEARARVNDMCDVLAEYASDGKIVYVSAHGWINRMLKGSLKKRGWKMKSQNGDLHWSFRRFERPSNYKKSEL